MAILIHCHAIEGKQPPRARGDEPPFRGRAAVGERPLPPRYDASAFGGRELIIVVFVIRGIILQVLGKEVIEKVLLGYRLVTPRAPVVIAAFLHCNIAGNAEHCQAVYAIGICRGGFLLGL